MNPYFVIIVNKHADSEQQIGTAVTPKGTLSSFPKRHINNLGNTLAEDQHSPLQ